MYRLITMNAHKCLVIREETDTEAVVCYEISAGVMQQVDKNAPSLADAAALLVDALNAQQQRVQPDFTDELLALLTRLGIGSNGHSVGAFMIAGNGDIISGDEQQQAGLAWDADRRKLMARINAERGGE
jgi:hypothetical protein